MVTTIYSQTFILKAEVWELRYKTENGFSEWSDQLEVDITITFNLDTKNIYIQEEGEELRIVKLANIYERKRYRDDILVTNISWIAHNNEISNAYIFEQQNTKLGRFVIETENISERYSGTLHGK